MSFSTVLLWIMAFGILLGALDKITGNHFGLGSRLEEGLNLMGPLALGMVGIVCLVPVVSRLIKPVLVPLCSAVGVDPSILGTLTANDMGGYQLSKELCILPQAGQYFGLIVSSMLGCTLTFTIPVGLGIIEKQDRPYFSRGLLYGLITLPAGCFAGGLTAGFETRMLIINTVPILAVSLLLALGMKQIPEKMIRGCVLLGQLITIVITVGLACAAFEYITGAVIIARMTPIMEAMESVSAIAVILAGTFPMLSLLSRVLEKPLRKVGKKIGLDNDSMMGIIISSANGVPVFGTMKRMKKRGIVIVTAWMVSASAVFGDHLGFTAGMEPSLIGAMIAGKLTAAVLAAVLAYIATKKLADESTELPPPLQGNAESFQVK